MDQLGMRHDLALEAARRLAPPEPSAAYAVPDALEYLAGKLGTSPDVTQALFEAYGRRSEAAAASFPRYQAPIGMEVPGLSTRSYGLPSPDPASSRDLGYEAAQRFASYSRN